MNLSSDKIKSDTGFHRDSGPSGLHHQQGQRTTTTENNASHMILHLASTFLKHRMALGQSLPIGGAYKVVDEGVSPAVAAASKLASFLTPKGVPT